MALNPAALAESFEQAETATKAVHFNVESFDNLIQGQGMVFNHFRSMPCPVGRTDRFDVRKTHEDHSGCSNGFLYSYVGEVTAVATGNSRNKSLIDVGIINGSSMQVNTARYYNDRQMDEVLVAPFDRFYLKDSQAVVVHSQLFEHNASGMDRLQYPVVKMDALIDNTGKSYKVNNDFVIERGQVKWTGLNRPGSDPTTSKGAVCSARYTYIPYWYVDRIMHEIRMVKTYDEETKQVVTKRMPYQIMLQRENVFEGTARNDPQAPEDARQSVAPRSGNFGPR